MMVLIIIICGLLQIIYNLLFKPTYNIAGCGIFGQATNNPKKINESNFKILGIFNESRGKNSCGITYDGDIYHGIEKEKLFTDFIKGRSIKPKVFPVIFGHTRQASSGVVNNFNCHPFGYGENKKGDSYKTLFVHNGTIYNDKDLAKEFEISTTSEYESPFVKGNILTRTKIDSEILGEIIHKTRNLKVLSKYNGRAALVWTDTDNPNIVCLWSGKSVPDEGDDISKAVEERPLNIWVENKNSFYFSSMPESLEVIKNNENKVFQIDYNTVYIVTDGNFNEAKKIKVSRKNNYHTEQTYYKAYSRKHHHNGSYWGDDYYEVPKKDLYVNKAFKEVEKSSVIQLPQNNITSSSGITNIYLDSQAKSQNDYGDRVYTKKLRYYRNGHLINGIYVWVPDYGFYFLSDSLIFAKSRFESIVGLKFVNNDFTIDDTSTNVVFADKNVEPKFFYFTEGVLLREQSDYFQLNSLKKMFKNGEYYDYIKLSHASVYPVIEINESHKPENRQQIFYDGLLYTGTITGPSFEKQYVIRNGNLINTIEIKPEVKETNSKVREIVEPKYNAIIMKNTIDYITKFEESIDYQESKNNLKMTEQTDETYFDNVEKEIINNSDVEDIVEALVNEHLPDSLIAFQECKEKVEKYLPHPSAKEVVKLIEDMSELIKNFITK